MKCRYRKSRSLSLLLTTLALLAAILAPVSETRAQTAPVVSNVQAVQRENSFIVDITYDVFDADGDQMWVSVWFSPDGGATWPVFCRNVSGDVGAGQYSGVGRMIAWDARADRPGLQITTAGIRVVADDEPPFPYADRFWWSDPDGGNEHPLAAGDTIPYARPFRLRWAGTAPAIAGLDPAFVAALDTVSPFDDGLMGWKYRLPGVACDTLVEDCWQPRRFNEATGDSFSYFSGVTALTFANAGTSLNPQRTLLPSGPFALQLKTRDILGQETAADRQQVGLVVNHDPQTVVLDGESDWAHPEDPEVYPYYIQLNDPTGAHHPFQAGDRVPDRTYVVFKALARDDPRDGRVDDGFRGGLTGYVRGVRSNFSGGEFSFSTDAAALDFEPAWDAVCDTCWWADTLGFLTGPSTTFTVNLQGIDEAGRRDATPAQLAFAVGYEPCVQCVEIVPKAWSVSGYLPDVACVDDPAVHPCFQDTTLLRVTETGAGANDLQYVQPAYILVDKQSLFTRVVDNASGQEAANYIVPAKIYRMDVLLHGKDDPREAWAEDLRRILGWRYQVDYECDPYNQIQDGGGVDDIRLATWGEPGNGVGLDILTVTGLWRMTVEVAVPSNLFLGAQTYLLLLQFTVTNGDTDAAQAVFDATTKQFGAGTIRAVALDQTACGALPVRPGRYNYFRKVRPSVAALAPGQTWRDCNLLIPDIKDGLSLADGAMASRGGVPVIKPFRLVVQTNAGDFTCSGP